jgi:hypothetical protein
MMGAVWLLGIPTLCGNLRSRGADATELQIDVEVSRYKCLNAWLIGFIFLAAVLDFGYRTQGDPARQQQGNTASSHTPSHHGLSADKTRTVPYRYLYMHGDNRPTLNHAHKVKSKCHLVQIVELT